MDKEQRLAHLKIINDIRAANKKPLRGVEPGYVKKVGDSDGATGGNRRNTDSELSLNFN
jgi:hypothetical protein